MGEALDRIAGQIAETQQRYGVDAVCCFGGGGLTSPSNSSNPGRGSAPNPDETADPTKMERT